MPPKRSSAPAQERPDRGRSGGAAGDLPPSSPDPLADLSVGERTPRSGPLRPPRESSVARSGGPYTPVPRRRSQSHSPTPTPPAPSVPYAPSQLPFPLDPLPASFGSYIG